MAFERTAKVDKAWHLETLWAWMVKVEMKANHLEAELVCTLKSHQGMGVVEIKPSKSKHDLPITRGIQGSSRAANEAFLQGYNFVFRMCELIIWGCFPEIGGVIKPSIPHNGPKEIVHLVRCRRERWRKALGLIDIILTPSPPKK